MNATATERDLIERLLKLDPNDYYAILDIPKNATEDQIKKSYKKQALTFHPDKNKSPGADEAFKLVGTAFAVLNDPIKRKEYDLYGDRMSQSSFSSNNIFTSAGTRVDPEEIFRAFFGEFTFGQNDPFFHSNPLQSTGGAYYFASGAPFLRRRFRSQPQPTTATQQVNTTQLLAQLIPIFVILFLSFLNSMFSY